MEEYDGARVASKVEQEQAATAGVGCEVHQASTPDYILPDASVSAATLASVARWARKGAALSGRTLPADHPLRLHVLLQGAQLALPKKKAFVRVSSEGY